MGVKVVEGYREVADACADPTYNANKYTHWSNLNIPYFC